MSFGGGLIGTTAAALDFDGLPASGVGWMAVVVMGVLPISGVSDGRRTNSTQNASGASVSVRRCLEPAAEGRNARKTKDVRWQSGSLRGAVQAVGHGPAPAPVRRT